MWLKNLPLKLTALGLAVLLWFHVATNRTYEYAREVRLTPGPLPSGFTLAAPLPETVHLLFTGTGKELLRFMWEDASAQFLLEPRMQGPVTVSAERLLSRTDADVQIAQVVEPATMDVFVDTVVTRYARVNFQGEFGTAPEVALTEPPRVEPDRVLLHGPQSAIQDMGSLRTHPVNAGQVSAELVSTTTVDLTGTYNVRTEPESVRVVFEVASRVHRELTGVAVETGRGWFTEPAEVTLKLSGAEAVLNEINRNDCRASVKITDGMADDAMVVVETVVPPLLELESVQPLRVKVFKR